MLHPKIVDVADSWICSGFIWMAHVGTPRARRERNAGVLIENPASPGL